jgi:hypothetical protein
MEVTQWSALVDEAELAYSDARHRVFDRPGWTPLALLTPNQTACLARLDQAEAAMREQRQRGAAGPDAVHGAMPDEDACARRDSNP